MAALRVVLIAIGPRSAVASLIVPTVYSALPWPSSGSVRKGSVVAVVPGCILQWDRASALRGGVQDDGAADCAYATPTPSFLIGAVD
jgi:hypothetical protein